jgi:prepilin-type processing-associated H-X9-DG protein
MTVGSDGNQDGICDFQGHRHPKVLGVKNSSEKILLGEIKRYGWLINWFAPNTWQGGAGVPGSDWYDTDWYRHSVRPGSRTKGKTNILWVDGHVTTVNQGSDIPGYFNNDIVSAADWVVGGSVAKRGEMQWFPNK